MIAQFDTLSWRIVPARILAERPQSQAILPPPQYPGRRDRVESEIAKWAVPIKAANITPE
jgi:hypothetical protein